MIYIILFILLLISFIITCSWLSKKIVIKTVHILNLFFVVCVVMFVALIIIYPKISYSAAKSGVNLWFNIVLPSILPFLIASEILIGLGFINFLGVLFEPFMRLLFNVPGSGSFAVAMGFTSGYPAGAKISTDLYEKGLCTKTEGERLLTFTNNSGPLFIIGAVSVGMFNNPALGFVLAIAHYSAAITVGMLFRFYKKGNIVAKKSGYSKSILKKAIKEMINARTKDGRNIGMLFGDAIKNSVNLMLMVGGFIILFSVIISLLTELNIIRSISNFLYIFLNKFEIDIMLIDSVLSGIFEITMGCKLASVSYSLYIQKIVATAFILGWAGLSVHLQVISIVSRTKLSYIPYLCAKFIQGIIAGLYTFILFNFVILSETAPVFNSFLNTNTSWNNYFISSGRFLICSLIILVLLGIVIVMIEKIKNQ